MTYISVIGTEGQGHYENQGVNEDQDGYVPMNRVVNDQDGYVLPMNRKPVTFMGVIGPESQGHYENREFNEEKEGYVPMNREVMTLKQGGATYDTIQDYENSAFVNNEKKNVYEGLQITRDEHPYADYYKLLVTNRQHCLFDNIVCLFFTEARQFIFF